MLTALISHHFLAPSDSFAVAHVLICPGNCSLLACDVAGFVYWVEQHCCLSCYLPHCALTVTSLVNTRSEIGKGEKISRKELNHKNWNKASE